MDRDWGPLTRLFFLGWACLFFSLLGVVAAESKASVSYVALTNWKNMAFTADVGIGSPRKFFRMLVATGSADLWVAAPNVAQGRTAYVFNESTFATAPRAPFTLQYPIGEVSGELVRDWLVLGNVHSEQAQIGLVKKMAPSVAAKFQHFGLDGIVGLAYPMASSSSQLPFLDIVAKDGNIPASNFIFSLYLNRSPGEIGSTLVVGGIDQRFYVDDLHYFPVIQPHIFWMIQMSGVALERPSANASWEQDNSNEFFRVCSIPKDGLGDSPRPSPRLPPGCRAVFDSGNSFISGPSAQVKELIKGIGWDNSSASCQSLEQYPTLIFEFKGIPFSLEPHEYIIQIPVANSEEKACVIAISAVDYPETMGPLWVLGTVFLQKYYTVYDRSQDRLGLATAAHL